MICTCSQPVSWRGDATMMPSPRRRVEVSDEVGMAQQVVEPVADVGGRIEPEQPRRGRIEPHDLVVGVQDDAAVARARRCSRALRAAAGDISSCGCAPSRAALSTRAKISAQSPRVSNSGTRRWPSSARSSSIEWRSVNATYNSERAGEPPTGAAEPPAEQQRRHEQRGERDDCDAQRLGSVTTGRDPENR